MNDHVENTVFTTFTSSSAADETRYLAITDAELISEHPELFDTLMDLAFDTLAVQHLTIRVVEDTPFVGSSEDDC